MICHLMLDILLDILFVIISGTTGLIWMKLFSKRSNSYVYKIKSAWILLNLTKCHLHEMKQHEYLQMYSMRDS